MRTSGPRGFSLLELAVVVGVISILAALLVPIIMDQSRKARLAVERESLAELGKAFKRFHAETYGWPFEGGLWDMHLDIDADQFTSGDTALFVQPAGLPVCTPALVGQPCWGGPYLGGQHLAQPNFLDAWGNPRLVLMVKPQDGISGGTSGAPNGMVVLYSRGPDGIDGTGCRNGSCTRDLDKVVRGQPSVDNADDIIVVVSAAR